MHHRGGSGRVKEAPMRNELPTDPQNSPQGQGTGRVNSFWSSADLWRGGNSTTQDLPREHGGGDGDGKEAVTGGRPPSRKQSMGRTTYQQTGTPPGRTMDGGKHGDCVGTVLPSPGTGTTCVMRNRELQPTKATGSGGAQYGRRGVPRKGKAQDGSTGSDGKRRGTKGTRRVLHWVLGESGAQGGQRYSSKH